MWVEPVLNIQERGKKNYFYFLNEQKVGMLLQNRIDTREAGISNNYVYRNLYTVLDIKRVENVFFHSMYIFAVILHAIDKKDIST